MDTDYGWQCYGAVTMACNIMTCYWGTEYGWQYHVGTEYGVLTMTGNVMEAQIMVDKAMRALTIAGNAGEQ